MKKYWILVVPGVLLMASLMGLLFVRAIPPKHAGAFTDFDFYVLAVAADLRTNGRLAGMPQSRDLELAARMTLALHRVGVVATESGWVFEPGALATHPDYAFAGQAAKVLGMKHVLVDDIAWDVSHFSRWPLFLSSHAASWPEGTPERGYYLALREGLNRQFFSQVVVEPSTEFPAYRTRNFMDGRNGVYRWGYLSAPNDGYGPFQLSGTLFYGWWTFVESPRARKLYRAISAGFPYSWNLIETYRGVHTTQERFRDGRHELSVRVAGAFGDSSMGCDFGGARRRVVDTLWALSGKAWLKRDLWVGGYAQSAQFDLMVPMHGAFRCSLASWLGDLESHFARFATSEWPFPDTPLLDRMHYLYFATRFVVLARESGRDSLIPDGLVERLEEEWMMWWRGGRGTISNTGWGEPAFDSFEDYIPWQLSRAALWRKSRLTGGQ